MFKTYLGIAPKVRLWNLTWGKDTLLGTFPRQTPNAAASGIPQGLCSGVGDFPSGDVCSWFLLFSLFSLNKVLHYSPLTWGLYCLLTQTSKLRGQDLMCAPQRHVSSEPPGLFHQQGQLRAANVSCKTLPAVGHHHPYPHIREPGPAFPCSRSVFHLVLAVSFAVLLRAFLKLLHWPWGVESKGKTDNFPPTPILIVFLLLDPVCPLGLAWGSSQTNVHHLSFWWPPQQVMYSWAATSLSN